MSLTRSKEFERLIYAFCVVLIAIVALIKFQLNSKININWDEFNYLRMVYDHLRGDPLSFMQSGHVYLFGWVPWAGQNEADQIVFARGILWVVRIAICFLMYKICRVFCNPGGAILAVISTLCFSNVMRHGEAFRFDILISFLTLLATYVSLKIPGWRSVILICLTLTASLAISIKTIFFLPMIGLVYFLAGKPPGIRLPNKRSLRILVVGLAAAACLTAVVIAWKEVNNIYGNVGVAKMMLTTDKWFPRRWYLANTLSWDKIFWGLLGAAFLWHLFIITTKEKQLRKTSMVSICFLIPLVTLALYRNSFSYFYVSIIPFAAISLGCAYGSFADRFRVRKEIPLSILLVICLTQFANALAFFRYNNKDDIAKQRQTIKVVHRLFPEPVSYIDRCGMVSSFPKSGPFMVTSLLQAYKTQGPAFEKILIHDKPRFLIANTLGLRLDLTWEESARDHHGLLEEDFSILRENFVHFWDSVWLAGKEFELNPAQPQEFEILMPGTYTVISEGMVKIDNKDYFPGSTIELSQGLHMVEISSNQNEMVRLLFGNKPPPVSETALPGKFFPVGLSYRKR